MTHNAQHAPSADTNYLRSAIYFAAVSGVAYVTAKWLSHRRNKNDALRRKNTPCTYKTPQIPEVPGVVQTLRTSFASGKTQPLEWRFEQLKQLRNLIVFNKEEIIKAVQLDLGKQQTLEVVSSEVNLIVSEIDLTISHLKKWAKPEKVYTPIAALPASSYVYKDPLGVVLIISPWNYPVNLALVPLMAAISGGNCAFLKVSRHSQHVGELLARLIPKYMDMECVAVESEGGAQMITALIAEKWDHIFFTGSVSVGKVVYEAAAKNLCPVTLELGGKNPCIVDDTIDINLAARRIAWGKWYNCGQTCIGVDYVLVHENVKDKLLAALKACVIDFYGEDPKLCPSYGRIISTQAARRLAGYMQDGDIISGGQCDVENKYIAPTILHNVKPDSQIMQEEIFGPLLPVISVMTVRSAVQIVNSHPLPLALYLFSNDKKNQEYVRMHTRSGGFSINDTLLHFTNHGLPFGGVGHSGLGQYHGKYSFDTFVHRRAVVKSTSK